MKKMNKTLITAFLSLGVLIPSISFATDGTEGTTSDSSSTVTVTIPELVKITGVANLSQTYNGTTSFDQNDNVCIYSNMTTGGAHRYTVNVTGSYDIGAGPVSGFKVGNSTTTDSVTYTVKWHDTTGTGGAAVTNGVDSTGHDGWSNSPNCSGGNNANFQVEMSNANLLAVHPAAYTSTLAIVITPVP